MKSIILITLTALLSFNVFATDGDSNEVPHQFVSGQSAIAEHVNENFQAVMDKAAEKQNRVTGVCPDGQAIKQVNEDGSVACAESVERRTALYHCPANRQSGCHWGAGNNGRDDVPEFNGVYCKEGITTNSLCFHGRYSPPSAWCGGNHGPVSYVPIPTVPFSGIS